MIRTLAVAWIILVCSHQGASQDQTYFSFHRFNWQAANPAAVDKMFIFESQYNYLVNLSHRQQWWEIEGNPEYSYVSFEQQVDHLSFRWGINVAQERTHAMFSNGAYINFTWSKNTRKYKGGVLHVGLSWGIVNEGLDPDKLRFQDPQNEPLDLGQNALYFDFGAGVLYRHQKQFYFGLSIPRSLSAQIFNSRNRLVFPTKRIFHSFPIYFLAGGILKFKKRQKTRKEEDWILEPSFWIRYIPGLEYHTLFKSLPISADFDLRLNFPNRLWISGGTGSNKLARIGIGYTPVIKRNSFLGTGLLANGDKVDVGIVYDLSYDPNIISFGSSLELNLRTAIK